MKFRLGIGATLALVFSLLTGASLWASYSVSRDLLEDAVREHEIDKIKTVSSVVTDLISGQEQHVAEVAHLMAADDDIANGMGRASPAEAAAGKRTLDASFVRAHVDAIDLIDPHETIVHRAGGPVRQGTRATGWGVAEALNGQGSVVSDTGPGGVAIRAIEPLRRGTQIVGALSVELRFDNRLMKSLSRVAGAELALLSRRGAPVVSEPALAQRIDAQAVAEAFQQKIPVYRAGDADHRIRVYLPVLIVDEGFVVLAEVDVSSAWQLLERNARRAALYAAAILVASVLAALLTLRYALRPLRDLRVRAQKTALALGGQPIQAHRQDEVDSVVEVLDTLTERLLQRNRELSEAGAAAEAASAAKSHFLSTMSHEIRTPLTGVLGMAELLQRTTLNAEQARYASAIAAAGHSLHDLLSDILELAKIDEDKVRIERVDFEPAKVLAALAAVYRELASSKGLVLSADFDSAGALYVCGDPTRLRQVLANLLGNALKFTPRGTIHLSTERLESPAGDGRIWLRFSVRDSGVGIAAETLPKLFQRFEQADSSTTRRFGGSGLGLVICKHLVELAGGEIHAESEPGVGSTFWFDLPFEAPSRPEPPTPPPPTPPRPTAPMRVLVAEDNPINQEIVHAMLKEMGASVTVVANGKLAVEAVQRQEFDLILMDCHMPTLDGYAATAEIRALQGTGPRIPIVAFTANAFVEDQQQCLAAGMDDFLAKPISSSRLAAVLARHAPRPASATPMPQHEPPQVPHADLVVGVAAPPPVAEMVVLDLSVLNKLPMVVNGSAPAFPERMLQMHESAAAAALAEIEAALAAGDRERVQSRLHTLKSSSAQVGALALADLAGRFERLLREGHVPAVDWVAQLRDAYKNVQQARRATAAGDAGPHDAR